MPLTHNARSCQIPPANWPGVFSCGTVIRMKTFTSYLATAILSAIVALTGAAALRGEFSTPTVPDYVVTTSDIFIDEDDPRWDCRVMGNRICGPTNVQGVPAGDYSR